ncbi:SRPBCC family protein [Pseudooceanicola nanhaiensis]|uniref:SRPBCC family protein n=1 Tax=Pseudooceanicola nanhaiensis TaxID=375761 RepID=UPI001CD368AB|nr:SRPBCC family protein [Pseudooceanicola nanhaiensis]MCA0920188.1 SRPBCC family protein [Pseudooceanicola nanhaiensis]
MSPETLTIDALIDAPPAAAWRAYTDPAHITGWNFASDDWHCPSASADLRPGGAYVARMEARDGSFGFDLAATYETVEPPTKVSMRLEDGRGVETTFAPEGDGTRVTTVFAPESQNPVEMQRAGWQAILDSFARYVTAHAAELA